MAKELQKCLIKYFSHLKIVIVEYDKTSKSVKEIIKSLKNRSEQLRLVKSSEVDEIEIYKIKDLREKLYSKIFKGSLEEIMLLKELLVDLNTIIQELKNRYKRLEKAMSNVSMKDPEMEELINGTPLIPRLEKLLELANDSHSIYHLLLYNITQSMNNLDHTNEDSIRILEMSFFIEHSSRLKIDRVRKFTENISKTEVSL